MQLMKTDIVFPVMDYLTQASKQIFREEKKKPVAAWKVRKTLQHALKDGLALMEGILYMIYSKRENDEILHRILHTVGHL